MNRPHDPSLPASASFATTNWSLVLAAGAEGSPEGREALAVLCQAYSYPLFTFARRKGFEVAEAEDLTQGFFLLVLEKSFLHKADRTQGRFRSFLLASFKHYLANRRRDARALKRGGDRKFLPLDLSDAENRYAASLPEDRTPDQMFDRQWALTLLDQVFAQLRAEQVLAGKEEVYDRLKAFLAGEEGETTYRESGAALNMTEGAVKMAVHRLRRRFGELLRQEIARTVSDPAEIDEELRSLFELFRG